MYIIPRANNNGCGLLILIGLAVSHSITLVSAISEWTMVL